MGTKGVRAMGHRVGMGRVCSLFHTALRYAWAFLSALFSDSLRLSLSRVGHLYAFA